MDILKAKENFTNEETVAILHKKLDDENTLDDDELLELILFVVRNLFKRIKR